MGRVKGIIDNQSHVQTLAEVEAEREKHRELKHENVGSPQRIQGFLGVNHLEKRIAQEMIQMQVLDDFFRAQDFNGAMPASYCLHHAHIVRQFIRMCHQRFRLLHHGRDPPQPKHEHKSDHAYNIPVNVSKDNFIAKGCTVVDLFEVGPVK